MPPSRYPVALNRLHAEKHAREQVKADAPSVRRVAFQGALSEVWWIMLAQLVLSRFIGYSERQRIYCLWTVRIP